MAFNQLENLGFLRIHKFSIIQLKIQKTIVTTVRQKHEQVGKHAEE
jgi:hypothetical protein